jgi:hypothetical protein
LPFNSHLLREAGHNGRLLFVSEMTDLDEGT